LQNLGLNRVDKGESDPLSNRKPQGRILATTDVNSARWKLNQNSKATQYLKSHSLQQI